MEKKFQADSITVESVINLSSQYSYLAPEALLAKPKRLDLFRYKACTRRVNERRKALPDETPYLTKVELAKLMDWKLSHGKFRPNLSNLIQQNTSSQVQTVTDAAFSIHSDPDQDSTDALKKLESLRGVGPATASLVLSVYDPLDIPFFSDELYRWCFWYSGNGLGWDRRIAYSWKQYFDFKQQVDKVLARLRRSIPSDEAQAYLGREVGCLELERAAYVLSKTEGKGLSDDEVAKLEAGETVRGIKRRRVAEDDDNEDNEEDAEEGVEYAENDAEPLRPSGPNTKVSSSPKLKKKPKAQKAVKTEAVAKSQPASKRQRIDTDLRRSSRIEQTPNYRE